MNIEQMQLITNMKVARFSYLSIPDYPIAEMELWHEHAMFKAGGEYAYIFQIGFDDDDRPKRLEDFKMYGFSDIFLQITKNAQDRGFEYLCIDSF